MATAASGPEGKLGEQDETRIPLTPTGLLIEGLNTRLSIAFDSVQS